MALFYFRPRITRHKASRIGNWRNAILPVFSLSVMHATLVRGAQLELDDARLYPFKDAMIESESDGSDEHTDDHLRETLGVKYCGLKEESEDDDYFTIVLSNKQSKSTSGRYFHEYRFSRKHTYMATVIRQELDTHIQRAWYRYVTFMLKDDGLQDDKDTETSNSDDDNLCGRLTLTLSTADAFEFMKSVSKKLTGDYAWEDFEVELRQKIPGEGNWSDSHKGTVFVLPITPMSYKKPQILVVRKLAPCVKVWHMFHGYTSTLEGKVRKIAVPKRKAGMFGNLGRTLGKLANTFRRKSEAAAKPDPITRWVLQDHVTEEYALNTRGFPNSKIEFHVDPKSDELQKTFLSLSKDFSSDRPSRRLGHLRDFLNKDMPEGKKIF